MIVTLILGIISVLFAYLGQYKNVKWGLKVSFSLIFLFLALRYNFGNDYSGYLKGFIEINKYPRLNSYDTTFRVEIGWLYLNRIFSYFGFFVMIGALALFNCIIYYRFIKKYVPIQFYWFAVFLYVFNTGFMLIHASAMRQSIAIALFIFSIDFLYKKQPIRYFLCIGLASLFHNSALILLPFYLLGIANWRVNSGAIVVILSIFASLFMFKRDLSPILNDAISIFFEKYEAYKSFEVGAIGSGLGIIYFAVLFYLTVYFERFQNKETALVFKIAIISFMFIPLGLIIPLIGRVGLFFTPATIIAYPVILSNFKKPLNKILFVSAILFITSYLFFIFFNSELWRDWYGTYHTVFSADNIY